MLAVHRIFQMIFGIIVSVTLLYFLISYSGDYQCTQKDLQRAKILKAFSDQSRDVYLTGISTNFTHFSRYNFSSCYIKFQDRDVPQMECVGSDTSCHGVQVSGIPIETPALFYPGKEVYMGRDTLDYGWWAFNIVEAMPDTVFVFDPIEGTEENWQVMRDIVEHLPATADDWSVVEVGFAFCDGSEILNVCGGQPCSKQEFLSVLDAPPSATSRCTASLKANMRLVTISNSCSNSFTERDVCIIPPNSKGVGNAFLVGSAKAYVWKDPLDLVSLALGGSGKDDFGKTAGERLYSYKNSLLMGKLSLASEMMSKRCVLVAGKIPEETGCGSVYIELSQVLDRIPGKDYQSLSDMYELNDRLNEAKALYQSLVEKGCERSEYGM